MTGQIITAAVALAALLIALPALRRATAALRLSCQHEEALRLAARETPLEALVDATRETPHWFAACGCRWEMPRVAGKDPAWVPCDGHAERLLRAVEGEESL